MAPRDAITQLDERRKQSAEGIEITILWSQRITTSHGGRELIGHPDQLGQGPGTHFRITWPRCTFTVASLIPETPPPVWTVALGPALYSPKKPNLNCRRTPPARVEETTACWASMRS